MGVIESAVSWARGIAADNSHGYSQTVRWGPSYDCSSFVISAYEQAGVDVKSAGASYTGNMYSAFLRCGFSDVSSSVNMVTGSGLQAGDVLLNKTFHTALCIGNGRVVHARSSEGTTDTSDGSGNEIREQAFWSYPWDAVLRFTKQTGTTSSSSNSSVSSTTSTSTSTTSTTTSKGTFTMTFTTLSRGSRGTTVKRMQQILNADGCNCGSADGVFGANTYTALRTWQSKNGLSADGIAGPLTMKKMFGGS